MLLFIYPAITGLELVKFNAIILHPPFVTFANIPDPREEQNVGVMDISLKMLRLVL
jgi:hypothetical protein